MQFYTKKIALQTFAPWEKRVSCVLGNCNRIQIPILKKCFPLRIWEILPIEQNV